jgi:hypothetical protein
MDTTTLLAARVNGSRRTAVLTSGEDERASVRAKLWEDDDNVLLQLRIHSYELGTGLYQHVFIDLGGFGGVLVSTTGKTDDDAFTRAKAELERRGITLTS